MLDTTTEISAAEADKLLGYKPGTVAKFASAGQLRGAREDSPGVWVIPKSWTLNIDEMKPGELDRLLEAIRETLGK
jgi:hypothetical protein